MILSPQFYPPSPQFILGPRNFILSLSAVVVVFWFISWSTMGEGEWLSSECKTKIAKSEESKGRKYYQVLRHLEKPLLQKPGKLLLPELPRLLPLLLLLLLPPLRAKEVRPDSRERLPLECGYCRSMKKLCTCCYHLKSRQDTKCLACCYWVVSPAAALLLPLLLTVVLACCFLSCAFWVAQIWERYDKENQITRAEKFTEAAYFAFEHTHYYFAQRKHS